MRKSTLLNLLVPLRSGWSRFCRDRRGAVAILVGAAIIPLIGALGLATDAARGYLVKSRLSQALDAAALAGGRAMLTANLEADVTMFFDANFPPGFLGATVDGPHIAVNDDDTVLTLTATAVIDTTFMRVLGLETLEVAASTEVTRHIDQLDLVISLDMSGSMDGSSKIGAARTAAIDLVNILFGSNTESPTITLEGTTYNLLNIGFVPWNSKVNVGIEGQTFTSTTTETVAAYTNPITGDTGQATLWKANNSPVPFLFDPSTLPGGWTGCVYARYLGDSSNANDADVVRGPVSIGGKDWVGWVPMAALDTEEQSGTWSSSEGPSGTRWQESSTWRNKQCRNAYLNDAGGTNNHDNADGTIGGSGFDTSRPAAVPNPKTGGSRAFAFIDVTQSYAQPDHDSNPGSSDDDCRNCLGRRIIPLQSSKATLVNELNSITNTDPDGTTNVPQGLYWAWEVLMPGVPFTEALETVPFPRTRAIVLLTDGAIVGSNGDAYMGRFGEDETAGTTTNSAHGTITVGGVSIQNNLNNRLRLLAENVRAEGIRLYVIGFDLVGQTTELNLLQSIATPEDGRGPYFYNAPTATELSQAFKAIAASLSKLRISK